MTKLLGIIGDPIDQVRSPQVFNGLFKDRGIDAVMVPMHIGTEGLEDALRGLRRLHNIAGLIITVPHKPAAARLLRRQSDRVVLAGAANALRPCPDGWEGDLFDGEGFSIGLERRGFELKGKACGVMGAGGAGAAIALALLERSVSSLAIWDTNAARVEALARRLSTRFPGVVTVGRPEDGTDLVANATPVGMAAEDPLPIDIERTKPGAWVAEAIMKPPVTRLLQEAQRRGRHIQEGRHMLDSQVDALWHFFGLG